MLTRRRLPAVLLATITLTAGLIAGCSAKEETAADLPDATTLVQESQTATAALKSVHLELSVSGTIENFPVRMLSGDLTADPATAAKGDATIVFGGADLDIEFVVLDATLYASMTKGVWDDYGPAAEIYDPTLILNPDTGLAHMLANFSDAKAVKHETIDGQDTIRVTGNVAAAAVQKLAPQLVGTEPKPTTLWIQADDPHQLVQAELEQSPGNTVQMTLSNWDAPVTVEKPAV